MKIGFYAPCNEHNRQAGPLLGLAYIAAYLERELGIDQLFLEVSPERIIEQKPDLIAISSFSEKYNRVLKDLPEFKKALPQVPIILGGPHISALPHSLHPAIDIGVVGEGEKPMKSLVELLLQGKFQPENLRQIKNLVFWNEAGEQERTLFEDRIKDLDILPLPKREMMRAWWPSLGQEVTFDRGVYTSRGCSFRCHFCMYSERANLIRYVSIDKVMEDIQDILRNYPEQRRIVFYDDLFVIKKSRLKELADAIRSENIHQKVSFGCMAKTSFFDEEFCQILRDMNMKVISWGFESGADRVLHYLKDRHSSVRKHQEALDLCAKYGLHSGGYFIIGSSLETQKELAKTYWFIRKNQPILPLISVFPIIPLPGTSLWHESASKGLIDDGFSDWDHLEFLGLDSQTYIHLNENYSRETLKQAYDHDFQPLMQWTTEIFSKVLEYENFLTDYYGEVAQRLQALLPTQGHCLVVHRGERELHFALETTHQASHVHWQDLTSLQDQAFDFIILAHTLEKIGFHSESWEQILAWKVPIYLLFENTGNLTHMLNLLAGTFPSALEDLEIYRQAYRFTRRSILRQIQNQPVKLKSIQPYRFDKFLAHHQARLEPLKQFILKTFPTQAMGEELESFSYGILLEPL